MEEGGKGRRPDNPESPGLRGTKEHNRAEYSRQGLKGCEYENDQNSAGSIAVVNTLNLNNDKILRVAD